MESTNSPVAAPRFLIRHDKDGDHFVDLQRGQGEGIVYGLVQAEQDRIRRDHRTAQERRRTRQRARQRYEDLTELLGGMALHPCDPDQAADLLRRTRAASHDIEGLVTSARSLALDLTVVVVAGVEALAAPPVIGTRPSRSRP